MACLHISLFQFYEMSPIEVNYALKAYHNIQETNNSISWEQIRVQVYYAYLMTPSKKQKVSYNIFKKDYLSFHFDKHEVVDAMSDETFDAIQDHFKKLEGTI